MAPKFSLNDADIREIYNVTQTSNNADVLRGMVYKLIKLRKEMAISMHQLASSRADLAAINESASAALAMDKKTGLLALLDRKGLIGELQQQVAKQLQALTRLANEKASLHQELQTARNSNDGKAIIQTLRQEIAGAEASLTQLGQQNHLVTAKANQLESNNQHLSEKVRQLEALIADLRQQLETAETLQKSSPAQVAQSSAKPEAPQAEANTFVRELFSQQIAALADKNMQLESEVALLNEQNHAISAQLQAARGQVEQLTGEMSALKEAHQAERDASTQELFAASTKLKALEQQLTQQIDQINHLTAENNQLQAELQASNTSVAELKQEIAAKNGQISSLSTDLESERERLKTLQSRLTVAESDLQTASRAISQRDDENQQIGAELQKLSGRLAEAIDLSTANELQLRAEIQGLNEGLRASQSRVEYLESDKVNLEKNIQRLNDRTDRLSGLKRELQASLRLISEDRAVLRQLAGEVSLENTLSRKENSELKELCEAQNNELERLGGQLSLASKVIHLRGPETRRDAQLSDESLVEQNSHTSESSGPSN